MAKKKDESEALSLTELTRWAADSSFVMDQRAMDAIHALVERGDVKTRLWLLGATRRKLSIVSKMIERLDRVGDELFTDERIKGLDLRQLQQLYALLSQDVLGHGESIRKSAADRVSLEDLVTAMKKPDEVAGTTRSATLLPQHREMARSLLLGFKEVMARGASGRPEPPNIKEKDIPVVDDVFPASDQIPPELPPVVEIPEPEPEPPPFTLPPAGPSEPLMGPPPVL